MKNKSQLLNERLSIYRQILNGAIQYSSVDQKDNFNQQLTNVLKDTRFKIIFKSILM